MNHSFVPPPLPLAPTAQPRQSGWSAPMQPPSLNGNSRTTTAGGGGDTAMQQPSLRRFYSSGGSGGGGGGGNPAHGYVSTAQPPPPPPPRPAAQPAAAPPMAAAPAPRPIFADTDDFGVLRDPAPSAAARRRSSLSPLPAFSGLGRHSVGGAGGAGGAMLRSPFLSPALPSPAHACLPESRQSLDEGKTRPRYADAPFRSASLSKNARPRTRALHIYAVL